MKRLSATEAISPAIDHVSRMLNPRRDWRLVLKITAVAFFAQMGGGFNLTGPGRFPGHQSPVGTSPHAPLLVPVLIAGSVVFFIVALGLFYVGSRLQFVLFDIVLNRQSIVTPSWRRFAPVTWRWMGLKLLFFLAMLLCLLPVLVPLILHFLRSMPQNGQAPGQLLPMIGNFFSFFAGVFLLVLVLGCVYCLLADFGLPFLALENTSIGETLGRLWSLVRAEPSQFALYLVMRFLLAFAGVIGCELAIALATLLLAIPLGAISFVVWLALRNAGQAGHFLMIAAWVLAGLVLLAFILLAAIATFGYLLTFIQAYAIYFMADRYPLLRETLDPTPGIPFTPPPPLAGPDEPGDDSGPGFPMDPVPA